MHPIAHIHNDLTTKFGVARQSGLSHASSSSLNTGILMRFVA